jgi:hypothetical protein
MFKAKFLVLVIWPLRSLNDALTIGSASPFDYAPFFPTVQGMLAKSVAGKASRVKEMTGVKVTKIKVETTYLEELLMWLRSYWTD